MLHLKKLRKKWWQDSGSWRSFGCLLNEYLNGWWCARGCALEIFFSSRLVFGGILIAKWRYIYYSDERKNHKRFRISYLLKEEREDLPSHLFEMLLMKIGLGSSSSCELSLWCRTTYVFSQWPHLSELERHSRYWVYRLAKHSWSADHFYWWLEDRCHRPVQIIVRRYKWRTL